MSRLTNYAENKIADFHRGQGLPLPSHWHFGLGSAANDASITELSGTGYGRVPVQRTLLNFAGTQGSGTTLASSGSSNTSSNNNDIDWGSAGSAWGTANYVGVFDAASGGNCWMYLDIPPMVITAGSPSQVLITAGGLSFRFGLATGATTYFVNKMVDLLFRGQAFSWPSTMHFALYTVAPTNAGGGSEVGVGSYARASVASSMTEWSGTQLPGTTTGSSGTSGETSNNNTFSYPAPTADQGTIVAEGLLDAATSGNLLYWGTFSLPKTVLSGQPALSHAPGTFIIAIA